MTEAEVSENAVTRKNATLKVLYHDCGCRKHICLVRGNNERKPCTISCRKCTDYNSIAPCPAHSNAKGYVRERMVVNQEYFS